LRYSSETLLALITAGAHVQFDGGHYSADTARAAVRAAVKSGVSVTIFHPNYSAATLKELAAIGGRALTLRLDDK